jgi:hypothetical protein
VLIARWWWYSDTCEQGLVQPFYRRIEVGRRGWVRHYRGRRDQDKAMARARRRQRIVARPAGIDGRVACASWQGRDTEHGKSLAAGLVDGVLGPVGGHTLARLTGAGMPHCVAVLLCRPGQSRGGERREREGGRKGQNSN